MAIVPLAEMPRHLRPQQRLLGLDLGTKTIGLAVSDAALRVAAPLATIRRGRFTADAAALGETCAARNIGGLVLGLPVNMDGIEGRRAQSTRQFAANLAEVAGLDLPIALWDERLSTAAVERMLIEEGDVSRARRGAVVDKLAAAYILQGALDYLAAAPHRRG